MFAICPLHCAHSPSLPDEVTESTTHCAKTETSRRYNSCTSQYIQLFITVYIVGSCKFVDTIDIFVNKDWLTD